MAQRNPLTGLTAMGHLVSLEWDDDIRMSEAQYTQELETAFELGLLRAGVTVGEGGGAGTALLCHVQMSVPTAEILGGNIVSTSINVSLMAGVVLASVAISGNTLDFLKDVQIAETWRISSVGTVGAGRLSGAYPGQWCAETFELAWRRANN